MTTILIKSKKETDTFYLFDNFMRCSKILYKQQKDADGKSVQTLSFIENSFSVEVPYRFVCKEMFETFGGFKSDLNIEMVSGTKITNVKKTVGGEVSDDLWEFMENSYGVQLERVVYIDAKIIHWGQYNHLLKSCCVIVDKKKVQLFMYSVHVSSSSRMKQVLVRRFATEYGTRNFSAIVNLFTDHGLLAFLDSYAGVRALNCSYDTTDTPLGRSKSVNIIDPKSNALNERKEMYAVMLRKAFGCEN